MRVSLEWFLLDNMAVNLLLLHLAGALGGMEVKPGRAVLVSLLGAVWDALALGRFPRLLSLPGRVACLLATAFLVGRRESLRAVLSLLVASVILGGALLLLTGGTRLRSAGPAGGGGKRPGAHGVPGHGKPAHGAPVRPARGAGGGGGAAASGAAVAGGRPGGGGGEPGPGVAGGRGRGGPRVCGPGAHGFGGV